MALVIQLKEGEPVHIKTLQGDLLEVIPKFSGSYVKLIFVGDKEKFKINRTTDDQKTQPE